ncbi:MAG: 4-hydroxythreonine-4-phosphate dehydrogenase PdxA [Planctomycetes bacterium]|nr:4-hydroxythreonine-4-phosphate dehydrogenase PdxA [Planctomycetota bacterium]
MTKPLLAITMGDPAGVGPEVIVKAWQEPRVHEACRPVVFGHPAMLVKAVSLVGGAQNIAELVDLDQIDDSLFGPETILCLPVGNDDLLEVPAGSPVAGPNARTGQAAYDAIVRATDEALAGAVQGIVTAPISKSALHAAGHRQYPGHTELLADRCGVDDFAMMLYLPPDEVPDCPAGLGVVHVTLHMALREVFGHLTAEAVCAKCGLADRVMREGFGLAAPRIGVCALNPHGGEEGLFGDEEIRLIAPAVAQAQSRGINATGPYPTDTLMGRARDGEFDAVVAMYHDQGHIALKLLGMHRAVNITLGLPIIRTSVAHGTAFDRAWQGTAESSGMVAALLTAAQLAFVE